MHSNQIIAKYQKSANKKNAKPYNGNKLKLTAQNGKMHKIIPRSETTTNNQDLIEKTHIVHIYTIDI